MSPVRLSVVATAAALYLLTACSGEAPPASQTAEKAGTVGLDDIARDYIGLVLRLGEHDDAFVDAFYGPDAWREEAQADPRAPSSIAESARALAAAAGRATVSGDDPLNETRRRYLVTQLGAVAARADMVAGTSYSFDEETRLLYDAVSPPRDATHFQAVLEKIDAIVPGDGPLPDRVDAFRKSFEIPADRLAAVFEAAIEECRKRTEPWVSLPSNESFRVEYVKDKPWGGYNWYQGDANSLIQVNTDLPLRINRAVDLGCHEGYPGHHVYNVLLEKNLVRDRGWPEFSVYALFSPQSLIAEGSANYGIKMAFPGDERTEYERTVLFPLAGLDESTAGDFYALEELLAELSYVSNEVARRFLDGDIDRAQAKEWLIDFQLRTPESAEKGLEFMAAYRGYVINYNVGLDMVEAYVERAAPDGDPAARWSAFTRLLSSPMLPADLQ